MLSYAVDPDIDIEYTSEHAMNTACLCLDTHGTCHSVASVHPVLYVAVPDQQMGGPPSNL